MKKLVSLLVLAAMLLSCTAMAETLLPYEGEEVVYEGYTADLGLTENRDSVVYQAYSELLGNVSINWSMGPWADFDTKTALFLNTGDLPDIVWLRSASDVVANYGDMGYFLNLMDYIDYMPNLKSYLETYPQIANMVTEDGALYCVNDIEPNDYVCESYYVNMTALEELGMDVPNTWDEMLECMRAYHEKHPTGAPFISYGWGESYYMYALSLINNAETGFYYDGEKWNSQLTNEDSGYYELIDMMHTMYSEGLLNPEFSTMSDEQAYQYVTDGEWLFSFFYINAIEHEIFLDEEIPYDYAPMLTPAYKEGDPRYGAVTVAYDNAVGWGYFVNADVENPELMCSYLDAIISAEASDLYNWGVKDVTYTVDENGHRSFIGEYTDSTVRSEAGVGNLLDVRYIQYKNREAEYACFTEGGQAAYDMVINALIDGDMIGVRALRGTPNFTSEESETIARSTTPFNTYIDENVMYFIDGTRDMSEWDSFVEETLALGNMDEVLSIYESAEQVIYSTERRYVSYN